MDVILLERVEKLGAMGQVVKVKAGYARNYLLPQGKALRATEANKKKFERDRGQLEARNAERRSGAEGEAGSTGEVARRACVDLLRMELPRAESVRVIEEQEPDPDDGQSLRTRLYAGLLEAQQPAAPTGETPATPKGGA